MDDTTTIKSDGVSRSLASAHRRSSSGSGILSKFPFMRSYSDDNPRPMLDDDAAQPVPRPSASVIQQQKTRRRRGSLRKVALLGRGAQRDRKDSKQLTIDTSQVGGSTSSMPDISSQERPSTTKGGCANSHETPSSSTSPTGAAPLADRDAAIAYTSTDEEDVLQISHSSAVLRSGLAMSPGPESYFSGRAPTTQRGRSMQHVKSPLSYSGLSSTPLPPPDSDWDYSETEWWGWVVLCVTWFVFVIGMGSCFNVWSWAWDVGKTPYAPPELEDDPTLPIVGYYPALLILTCIMAWVWVVAAWVGMKYFRHAKISGD